MRRRLCQRFTKRFETAFTCNGIKYRGISSDLSAGGLFIRTQNGFTPGTIIDIELFLSNNNISFDKGIVRRTVRNPITAAKNGMGIELIERDSNYIDILKEIARSGTHEESVHQPKPVGQNLQERPSVAGDALASQKTSENIQDKTETVILTCGSCQVKNRVYKAMLLLGPKCGRCSEILDVKNFHPEPPDPV